MDPQRTYAPNPAQNRSNCMRLPKVVASQVLNTSKDRHTTTSLGNLLQSLIAFMLIFSIIFNQNF